MTLAILQARMSSTRLPGKVLRPILGRPMIARQVERLRRAERLTGIVVATSTEAEDDQIATIAGEIGVGLFRGDLHDVLDRFHGALRAAGNPERFVRLTADCPLADPMLLDACMAEHEAEGWDVVHVSLGATWPKGRDVEVVRTAALEAAWAEAHDPYEREHVTPFIYRRPERFRIGVITHDPPLRYRWTVDTPEDFAFVTAVYEALHPANPAFKTADVLTWQAAHPERVIPNVEATT